MYDLGWKRNFEQVRSVFKWQRLENDSKTAKQTCSLARKFRKQMVHV